MKIISRTLAVLAAALLVCGAAYALAQSSGTNSNFPERGGFDRRGQLEGGPPLGQGGFGGSERRPFPGDFGRERGRGMSLFGAVEVFRNLVIIAVIIAIAAPIAGRLRKRRPNKPAQPHSPPSASQ